MDIPLPRRKNRFKWWSFIATLLMVGILAWVWNGRDHAVPRVARSKLFVAPVRAEDLVLDVQGYGVLVPFDDFRIGTQVEGVVSEIHVTSGTKVEADTALVTLTNESLTTTIREAELALDIARADLVVLEAELERESRILAAELESAERAVEDAEVEVGLKQVLHQQQLISGLEFRQAQTTARAARVRARVARENHQAFPRMKQARSAAQKARVRGFENELELKRRQQRWLTVRSGVGGVVRELVPKSGERVVDGDLIARIANTQRLKAELRIREKAVDDIHIGQRVTLTLNNQSYEAEVSRINPEVADGAVIVEAVFVGDVPRDAPLGAGLQGSIHLETLVDTLVLKRPNQVRAFGRTTLFRLVDNGRFAERVMVEFGKTSALQVQILSGLEPGDEVILSDLGRLETADRIRIF